MRACYPQFLDVYSNTLLIAIGRRSFANSLPFAVRFLRSEEFQEISDVSVFQSLATWCELFYCISLLYRELQIR